MSDSQPTHLLEQWRRYYKISTNGAQTCLRPRDERDTRYGELVRDLSAMAETIQQLASSSPATPVVRIDFGERGSVDYYPCSPCFFMAVTHEMRSVGSESISAYRAADWCVFRVRLAGEFDEGMDDREYHHEGLSCSFIYFGSGLEYRVQLMENKPISGISLAFKPEFVQSMLGADADPLLARLCQPGPAERLETQIVPVAVTPAVVALARQILAMDTSDGLTALAARGKAQELLSVGLLGLRSSGDRRLNPVSLKVADLQQLNAVRIRLEVEYAQNQTIKELSRWAGLNRRKLTEGFKSVFGVTVNQYLLCQRMGRARELLGEGIPVWDVARRVGYNDAASFSRAFKRSEGVSPSKTASQQFS